jgi:hypothetical protein
MFYELLLIINENEKNFSFIIILKILIICYFKLSLINLEKLLMLIRKIKLLVCG